MISELRQHVRRTMELHANHRHSYAVKDSMGRYEAIKQRKEQTGPFNAFLVSVSITATESAPDWRRPGGDDSRNPT